MTTEDTTIQFPPFGIRLVRPSDREEVENLFLVCFGAQEWRSWVEEELNRAVFCPNPYYYIQLFVIEIDGKIVAAAGIADSMCLDTMKTLRLAGTLPEYRNRGCLNALIQHRLSVISNRCELVMVTTKFRTRYERYGFRLVERDSNGYNVLIKKMR